uniref:Uncharacterized protein n=1 Tax=Arion vulgaris TaxID=1028688 RepID=A0A0B7BHZ6_9EUPU
MFFVYQLAHTICEFSEVDELDELKAPILNVWRCQLHKTHSQNKLDGVSKNVFIKRQSNKVKNQRLLIWERSATTFILDQQPIFLKFH